MLEPLSHSKVWGRVCHIFASPQAAVSLLDVTRGFRCSKHFHHHRVNLFVVARGAIIVEQWQPYSFKLLTPGDTHIVPAGVWHRFRVVQSGEVVELYWPDGGEVDIDDIEREDEGGPDDMEELARLVEQS